MEIGKFLLIENFDLFFISKSFQTSSLCLLKTAFVSISTTSFELLKKYAWCIDELYWTSLLTIPNVNFPRLTSLTIQNQHDTILQLFQFPMLRNLSIRQCTNINFNTLQLISLYVNSYIHSSYIHDLKTLKYLHFSSSFSINGMIALLKTLPNLMVLQINDWETRDRLRTLFPKVDIQEDWSHFQTQWEKIAKRKINYEIK